MKKRIFSFVLAVLMIASLLPATALAANIVDSGTCGANGSNLTWTLDSIVALSDAMRSRGAALKGRTAYSLYRFDHRDRTLVIALFTLITLAITGGTEYMQTFTPEEYRRWFDWHDIAAQGIGAVAMGVVYSFLQLLWCKKNIPEKA